VSLRRTEFLLLQLHDGRLLDLRALFGGAALAGPAAPHAVAWSLLTGRRHQLSPAHLDALLAVPSRWTDGLALEPQIAADLVAWGLVLSSEGDGALRERDAALDAAGWNLYAAAYHLMTQWSGVDVGVPGADQPAFGAELEAVEASGPAPPAFHPGPFAASEPLPAPEREGQLFDALRARRTTRAFDTGRPLSREALGTILQYVFGMHGSLESPAGTQVIKRTSPSGGGLHPVEAYPVLSGVEGVEPGIFHYDVRGHGLQRIETLDAAGARALATAFVCGQDYFGDAHASFVLTARYARNHWKYDRHQRAYAAILMDAAHLSQTLYLVAAALGLGAYVTIAVNGRDIERRLGLDGIEEGVVAVCGCGPRRPGTSELELDFT
jgi:putative peptide maturation dehydrogenase